MSSLTKEEIIIALKKLSNLMHSPNEHLNEIIEKAGQGNAWFTVDEVIRSISSFAEMLNDKEIERWFQDIEVSKTPKKIGLILAGNIPMVGFHDVLCVLCTGNIAMLKLSSSDDKLLPAILKKLVAFEPKFSSQIVYVERLKDFDAIIATGSNNSSRYFDYYFGKVPNIIRKNRNSVAVLSGDEKVEDIEKLGLDIFSYFGLGCRNVSKIYVPKGYNIKNFFEPLEKFQPIIHHFKYNNNYDYNKSIYLVNNAKHLDNGFLLLKEDESFVSPLAVLFYEEYDTVEAVTAHLVNNDDQIQCIVSSIPLNLPTEKIQSFGESQHPKLWDYADNVNTIDFLQRL